jgi:hypothetical protein
VYGAKKTGSGSTTSFTSNPVAWQHRRTHKTEHKDDERQASKNTERKEKREKRKEKREKRREKREERREKREKHKETTESHPWLLVHDAFTSHAQRASARVNERDRER